MIRNAKKHVHLESHIPVSQAIQTILRHQLDHLIAWEHAARSPADIEGVHQTRVAFRRMRSALTVFRKAIPKSETVVWARQMRELAGQLGKARDLDVLIDEALSSVRGKLPVAGERTLEALVRQHREQAYEGVRAMLDSEAYDRFKGDFVGWVNARQWENVELETKQRRLLQGPLASFGRNVLDRQEHKVLEAGSDVDKEIGRTDAPTAPRVCQRHHRLADLLLSSAARGLRRAMGGACRDQRPVVDEFFGRLPYRRAVAPGAGNAAGDRSAVFFARPDPDYGTRDPFRFLERAGGRSLASSGPCPTSYPANSRYLGSQHSGFPP